MTQVDEARIDRYLALTAQALEKLQVVAPKNSFAGKAAGNFLDMAKRYHADARHFRSDGDFVTAFACVNYAHGWLDAGARLGLFDVGEDDRLFTLLE